MTMASTKPALVKYVLRDANGEIVQRGHCEAGMVSAQGEARGLIAEAFEWEEPALELETLRQRALDRVDAHYAAVISSIYGQFPWAHQAKLEQARAGGGPLVADEEDRLAIIAKAADQLELLEHIEPERIAMKRAVREAESIEALEAATAGLPA